MGIAESLVFYIVIGAAVATAMKLVAGGNHERTPEQVAWWQLILAAAFWPMYLPVLLARERPHDESHDGMGEKGSSSASAADDKVQQRIAQVERELDRALASLDGWAEESLARQRPRIAELQAAWRSQAARIRQLDQLLSEIEQAPDAAVEELSGGESRVGQCEAARRQNIARLRAIRTQASDDLAATLASVREMATMIHLAKFTGAPPSRADELVAQIAAAVEGLTEAATWQQRGADAELSRS